MRRTLVALLLALLVSAAGGLAQTLNDDPRVASALELFAVWLEAQHAYEDVPGLSMAVVHDQEVLWKSAFGYADRARQAAASTRTLYSICSI